MSAITAKWLISHIIVITRLLAHWRCRKCETHQKVPFSLLLSLRVIFLFSVHQALIFKSHDDATRLFLWPLSGGGKCEKLHSTLTHSHTITSLQQRRAQRANLLLLHSARGLPNKLYRTRGQLKFSTRRELPLWIRLLVMKQLKINLDRWRHSSLFAKSCGRDDTARFHAPSICNDHDLSLFCELNQRRPEWKHLIITPAALMLSTHAESTAAAAAHHLSHLPFIYLFVCLFHCATPIAR